MKFIPVKNKPHLTKNPISPRKLPKTLDSPQQGRYNPRLSLQ